MDRHSVEKHLNKTVEIETCSRSKYRGEITDMDDFGIHFIPTDGYRPVSISWRDIRKIIEAVGEVKNADVRK